MNRTEYLSYLTTEHWLATRKAKLIAVDWQCENCGAEMGDVTLDVHHLNYARIGEESMDDLKVLCRGCHGDAHGKADR